MHWHQLYTAKRTGSESSASSSPETIRNSFQRDYDRLIFSSAFRRLQNKTQVFPLPGAVFVHNRLTHSLEVASIGRSLGKAVGDQIAALHADKGEDFREFYSYELPSVIAAACLAHDIGNPPFGHSGEDAIRTFFRELDGELRLKFDNELSKNQQRDFLYFEGNANAFRILTHAFNEPRQGGFRLTYTTLASIVKYPCDSANGFNKQSLFTKKSGFFDSEINTWNHIASALQLQQNDEMVFARHPFVYLVEAADDICYRIIDFEDAHRLNIISYEQIEKIFLAFFDKEEGFDARDKTEETLQKINDPNQKVQYLRAKIINLLVKGTTKAFMDHETALLNGSLQHSLIDLLPAHLLQLVKEIDAWSVKHIYNHRSVIEIEIAGYNVIGSLLKEFVAALEKPSRSKSRKLLQIIPAQFAITRQAENWYSDLQSIVDYISGMTDLFAIDMYRKVTGIELPSL